MAPQWWHDDIRGHVGLLFVLVLRVLCVAFSSSIFFLFLIQLCSTAIRLLMTFPTTLITSHFSLAFAFAPVLPYCFTFLFRSSVTLAEPLPSPLAFLLISSFNIEPLLPSNVRLGLFESESTNVSHESSKVIYTKMVLSWSSKGRNLESCNSEGVPIKADKCSIALFDSSSCIHTSLCMRCTWLQAWQCHK